MLESQQQLLLLLLLLHLSAARSQLLTAACLKNAMRFTEMQGVPSFQATGAGVREPLCGVPIRVLHLLWFRASQSSAGGNEKWLFF